MQRYQDLSLNIQSFRLRSDKALFCSEEIDHNMIANAMKLGATDLQLELRWTLTLPREVLGSETLLRLSVSKGEIDGDYAIRSSRLKSISLKGVRFRTSERFKDIMISCCNSLEELSLTYCHGFTLSRVNMNELRKLRHLYLEGLGVHSMFFTDLESRFPCLKDLTIHNCHGYTKTHIATTSLQTISFKHVGIMEFAKFDVPNIRKFVYSGGFNLPLIDIGAPNECECDITIICQRLYKTRWFLILKRLLTKFKESRISLFIRIWDYGRRLSSEYAVGSEVEAEPIVVENLKIQAQSQLCCALVLRLLGICRPKFITHWVTDKGDNVLYKKLMHKLITPDCGIPDQDMFGRFGMKEVNMEVYEEFDEGWRPLVLEKPLDVTETPNNSPKVGYFELIWD